MKKYLFLLPGFFILCACGKSHLVYKTDIQLVKAPQFLLEALPLPSFTGSTNEELLLYTLGLEENLSLCNARLHAIKKSMEEKNFHESYSQTKK